MSDISSVSEFESELGYASCENDDDSLDSCVSDGGQKKVNITKRKLQRKHRLDQLRRYEFYSNDSDTTIDDNVTNARRVRRTAVKQEAEAVRMNVFSAKPKQRLSNEFKRTRNGSKGSWTDSGVSMSKTDSQPNTLGDRTKPKMMSQKFALDSVDRPDGKADTLHDELEEMSPVELLRGEIRRRSRSSSENAKRLTNQRNDRHQSVSRHQLPNDAENAEWSSLASGLADVSRNESNSNRDARTRYPEIIRLEDKEKSFKVKKVPSKKHEVKGDQIIETTPTKVKEGENFNELSEKENEIIRTLLENASEAESKRKSSVQSHWSHSTNDGASCEGARPRRSKLQRLKEIFLGRTEKSRNGRTAESSPLKNDLVDIGHCSSPSFDSYFSDDTSTQGTCVDHLCCCDYDDYDGKGIDHLSQLGRAVHAKKRNIISRLFRSISRSSDNIQNQNGRAFRSRSQITSEVPIGRKRSGSTRSLPDSLKYLYLKALSKSVDNVNSDRMPSVVLQQTGVFAPYPGFCVKRSRSSSSLFRYQLGSNIPIDVSKSSEAIPYYNIRSPPVRRSESLRSLNKNCDIATHVLHSKTPLIDDVKDNNNLLYHPYFQGHTARDDCNMDRSPDQNGTSCACHMTRDKGDSLCTGYANSPLSSPRSCFKGQCLVKDGSLWPSNDGMSIEANKLLSPQRRAARGMPGCYQDNLFEDSYFFAGDICAQGDYDGQQALLQRDAVDHSPRRRNERRDLDCLVVAPLQVKVTKERHAERIRLKTARDFDTSV